MNSAEQNNLIKSTEIKFYLIGIYTLISSKNLQLIYKSHCDSQKRDRQWLLYW